MIRAAPPRLQKTDPDHSRYARMDDLTLHYLEHGKGDVHVLIIPGITSPAMTWGFVARELAATYHVYTVDNRGRGLSDKPAAGYRLSDYTSDLLGLMDELKLDEPVVLLGHSMGARIAASLAVSHPGKATALILADPPVSGPGRASYPYATVVTEAAVAELRRANPAVGIEAVPESGHMIPWDNLRSFLEKVNGFVQTATEKPLEVDDR